METLRNRLVLIVDDQEEIHQDFAETLRFGQGPLASDAAAASFLPPRPSVLPELELRHARSGEDACAAVEDERRNGRRVAVAYVDVRMPPGIDGVETVRRLRRIDRDIEVVLMTAYSDKSLSEIVDDMELLHKLLYVRKPFAREEVQQITLSLAMKWNVERTLEASRQRLAESHGRLEAVLDATGDAVAMYDGGARLVFANRCYERLFDVPPQALRELPPDAAMRRFREVPPSPPLPAGSDLHAAAHAAGDSFVEPAASPPGPEAAGLFHRSWRPVRNGGGDVLGDLVVLRDVSQGVEIERMKLEVERLRAELQDVHPFDGIVGSSVAIRRMCALLKRAVDSDVSVLVEGESGTGKELVARALHFNGPRREGPFLAINMAAVPGTLIESELFGHERGAFTGAAARRIGYFEQAHGGTLVLDEIGDMPSVLQAKLLRVLQEGRIRRVGGETAIPVDVRIIASTNRDLGAAMRDGTFREDLYYRLAVFPVSVPPLRKRPEDVPLLAAHFLEKHAARLGRPVRRLSAGAVLLLERHHWPGNVRELENVICRALVLETTDVLQAGNLPPELSAAGVPPVPVTPLAEMERRMVERALEASDHNLTRAARALGIDRTTLHRKLKKYGRRARG